ncbi:hypothetical protein ACNT2N_12220 [Pseudomonas thivervalensis]|uniref:Uncharacterized protein n=1 Tax=Pseudomonas thivervalensis TaxID=86265 RepID=A0A2Z4ZBS6_9PSED|nr:hypothetical protein [Pseudomonas thivervalensis]AXA55106.1 hypothetical protein CE140_12315 [Pseudomonas thivervalensis]AXA60789.1 hypothetical protein CEQ51_12160 [Pseudomonas thivervalensis]
MNKLLFEISPIDNAQRVVDSAGNEWYSEISARVCTKDGCEISLFKVRWDCKVFLNWLQRNEFAIQEKASLLSNKYFLARAIVDKYQQDLSDDEEDLLYEYRKLHDLRFALRGVSVPSIIIGVGQKGGELSICNASFKLFCLIDVSALFEGLDGFMDEMARRVINGYFEGEKLVLSS